MTTVSILPVSNEKGELSYRAIAGYAQSTGKTPGQALDALTAQLGESEFNTLLVIQKFQPDKFFTAQQQARLIELMELYQKACNQGQQLSEELQAKLENLVEAELQAATLRTTASQVTARQLWIRLGLFP